MKSLTVKLVLSAIILSMFIALPLLTKAQPGPAHAVLGNAVNDTNKKKWIFGVALIMQGNSPDYVDPYNNEISHYNGYNFGYAPYSFNANEESINHSFSFALKGNCCFKDDRSLKYVLGMESFNYSYSFQDNTLTNLNNRVETAVQRCFYASTGCQQNIPIDKYFYLYAGIDFTIAYYTHYTQVTNYNSLTYSPRSPEAVTLTLPAGVSFGLGPVIGFTIKTGEHLGLGAEVTQALLYQYVSGTQSFQGSGSFVYNYSYSYKYTGWENSGTIISVNLLYIN